MEHQNLLKILLSLDEENVFFFKSKFDSYTFLSYGEFREIDIHHIDVNKLNMPLIFIGDFEGGHKSFQIENFYEIKDQMSVQNINRPFKELIAKEHQNITFKRLKEKDNSEKWNSMISNSLELFNKNILTKIVLSRQIHFEILNLKIQEFLKQLLTANDNASNSYFVFYKRKNDFFISLTPEKFIKLIPNANKTAFDLETIALAGSMPVTGHHHSDQANTDFLLNDKKLIHEHQIVANEIFNNLKNLGTEIHQSEISIMKLDYIQHRAQTFKASIQSKTSLVDIINLLHPTSAVGGNPKELAQKYILKLENEKRGHYAAPIGVITPNHIELAVGLRSAEYKSDLALLRLFVGCGIVKGSNALDEWNETENKAKPFLKMIQKSEI
jgi:menaquinone-specific isochorismate synthase